MTGVFAPIDAALALAHERGRKVPFWWRDDDAISASPALDQLLALSARYRAPLALAVVADTLTPSLAPALADRADVSVLVHGFAHKNHAPQGVKKAEFGAHRPLVSMADEAERALTILRSAFGRKLLPVFVPPWNRVAPDLVPVLAARGFTGLSAFGERKACTAAPGLTTINTHIDPIDWHGGRGLADLRSLSETLARAIARRIEAETTEPIGLLTHHLVHDEVVWAFCADLLERLANSPSVCFGDIAALVQEGAEPAPHQLFPPFW